MPRETVEEILADANEARTALGELELLVQKEIKDIEAKAAAEHRWPNAEEKARRKKLRAQKAEIAESFRGLADITLMRLDDSADVQKVLARMQTVNDDLAEDLEDLKQIEGMAAKAAKVAGIVEKIATKLAGLVT
ncbi:MAG: hypothetical protein P1U37_13815 [Minwuia sp.]|nr:hypothetical protein [Minwuia sp.]